MGMLWGIILVEVLDAKRPTSGCQRLVPQQVALSCVKYRKQAEHQETFAVLFPDHGQMHVSSCFRLPLLRPFHPDGLSPELCARKTCFSLELLLRGYFAIATGRANNSSYYLKKNVTGFHSCRWRRLRDREGKGRRGGDCLPICLPAVRSMTAAMELSPSAFRRGRMRSREAMRPKK